MTNHRKRRPNTPLILDLLGGREVHKLIKFVKQFSTWAGAPEARDQGHRWRGAEACPQGTSHKTRRRERRYRASVAPALALLDGWGIRKERDYNAIALAGTPHMDEFYRKYPSATLHASEHSLGLRPRGIRKAGTSSTERDAS